MAKRRRSARRKPQQQKRLLISGSVVLVVAAFALFLIFSTFGGAAPEVAAERLALDPVYGNPEAPVTIVEYGAYGCHACQSWHQAGLVEQIVADFPDQVNFVYRDFPVIVPHYDRMAARTAQCALDQGNDLFWEYHDALFKFANPRSTQSDLIALGDEAGLDTAALEACVNANTHAATVQVDEDAGRALGLPGTPAFLVNGQRVFEASPETLYAAVAQALAE